MALSKRILDLAVSSLALIALAPVMLLVALLVLITIGRPILFTQLRPGLGGNPFRLIKFRSMVESKDAAGALLPDERRLGRSGRFLRASSLDELPQLINVVRGEMSLVGPRPLLMEYLPLYSRRQFRRHEVKPGLTGLAQVKGRNNLVWDEKFELDVWYVEHWSFALDLKILMLTAFKLFARSGVSHQGHASMPKFRGSGDR